jgi:hypothetical protein
MEERKKVAGDCLTHKMPEMEKKYRRMPQQLLLLMNNG